MSKPAKPATGEEKKDVCIGCKYCVSRWSKIFHAIQYLGTGFLFSFIALYLLQAYAPRILNIETITVEKGSNLPTLINSYQAIITSYYNTICVFFGVFALLSISSFMLNKNGAKKVDKEYKKAKKLTKGYKEQLDKEIKDFKGTLSDTLQSITIQAEKERRISQSLSDAYNEYSKNTPEGYNSAISISDSIINQYGDIPSAYFLKGNALADQEKHEEAIKCYDKAIEINPKNDNAYTNKGISLAKQENHEEAIKCYDKAIEINPKNDSTYNSKGISLAKQEKYEEAIKCYDKAIEINLKNYNAYYNKGNALAKQENHEEAIKCYDKAIEINPKNDNAYTNKGISLAKQENHKEAIKCYDKAIEIKPKNDNAYTNKGISLAKQENHEEAIKCYDKAIEINLKNYNAYTNKGILLAEQEKYEDAIECYNKAIEINPSIQIDYNMACLYSLWHTSKTDIKNKPINCLEKCKEHLILAMQSGELSKLGISHIKNDHDLVNVKDLDWFNDIMREAFGKDEWDNYKEEPNKETE